MPRSQRNQRRLLRLAQMATDSCPRVFVGGLQCKGALTNRVVGGKTTPHCARCARYDARQCVECASPLTTQRGARCIACRKLAAQGAVERYQAAHRPAVLAYYRQRNAERAA